MIDRILFVGSKSVGLETLRVMQEVAPGSLKRIITCDDSAVERSRKDDFVRLARQYDIDLLFSFSSAATHEMIKDYHPNLCVVADWHQTLNPKTFIIPKFGFIGMLLSIVTKGSEQPLIWKMMKDEEKIGATLSYLGNTPENSKNILLQVTINSSKLSEQEVLEQIELAMLSQLRVSWHQSLDEIDHKQESIQLKAKETIHSSVLH